MKPASHTVSHGHCSHFFYCIARKRRLYCIPQSLLWADLYAPLSELIVMYCLFYYYACDPLLRTKVDYEDKTMSYIERYIFKKTTGT
jgi:hypothetical protein